MHAGTGLCNKLNLTSSEELMRTWLLLFTVCLLFVKSKQMFYPSLPPNTNSSFFMCLSWKCMLAHRRRCQVCCVETIFSFIQLWSLFYFFGLKILCAAAFWQNEDERHEVLAVSPAAARQRRHFEAAKTIGNKAKLALITLGKRANPPRRGVDTSKHAWLYFIALSRVDFLQKKQQVKQIFSDGDVDHGKQI